MKKIIALLFALILITLPLTSCNQGTSIAIGALRLDNEVENLFKFTSIVAYDEKITYYDATGTVAFSASYYYEKAEDIQKAVYNVIESYEDYTLMAYEGSIYTVTEGKITTVLPLSGTYVDFVESYIGNKFLLEPDILLQRNSQTKDDVVFAKYEGALTPQQTARASELGVRDGDMIIATYGVRDSLIESVQYEIERDAKTTLAATRDIVTYTEKEADRFSALDAISQDRVTIDIIFLDGASQDRQFTVPVGVYVGMETGAHIYEFYYDAECTEPYSYQDKLVEASLTLYAIEK